MSKCRLSIAMISGVTFAIAGQVGSAPPSTSARAHSTQPSRAAYISAREPAERPVQAALLARTLGGPSRCCSSARSRRRRCLSSSFTIAGCSAPPPTSARSARASPRCAFTLAPCSSKSRAPLDVAAARDRASAPSRRPCRAPSTSAPASSSCSITRGVAGRRGLGERRRAVVVRGVHVGAGLDQPCDEVARRRGSTAQCSAVVPSGDCCFGVRAVARAPRAPRRGRRDAPRRAAMRRAPAMRRRRARAAASGEPRANADDDRALTLISDLRELARAVADLVDRHAGAQRAA